MTLVRALLPSFVALLTASPAWALNPKARISQYGHSSWRTRDGYFGGAAPTESVQTRDGFLWISTRTGLIRFDGVRFRPWSPPEGQRLPGPVESAALLAAHDGSLWIGADGYLSHWNNERLINYPVDLRIYSILEARDGTVWFCGSSLTGKQGGLCRVQGSGVRCYGKAEGIEAGYPKPIAEDEAGNLWMGADANVLRWTPASHTAYPVPGLRSKTGQTGVAALVPAPDGSIWVGIGAPGPGLGLQRLVGGNWKAFTGAGLDGTTLTVTALHIDRDGALWVGTFSKGVYRIHGETVDHFGATDGLSGDSVIQLFEDREGTLVVTTPKGLDTFRDLGVVTFSTREGLSTDEVDSVLAARDGTVWAGGAEALDAIRDGVVTSFRIGRGLPGTQVTSMLEDRAGRLWVGLDDSLTVLRDGHFQRIDIPAGMVMGLTEDVDGSVWAELGGSPRKLVRIQEDWVREVFPDPRVPTSRRVAADPAGGVWLGLASGELARLRGGVLESFSFGDDPNRLPALTHIQQIVVSSEGTVLGATGFGLIGWRNGTKRLLTVRNGLPCDRMTGMVEDGERGIWLATACGLLGVTREELDGWWKDPQVQVHPKVLDVLDGWLPGGAAFQAAGRSPDGRLWFANAGMLQMVDPEHLPRNTLPPPVHVDEVIADRRNYALSADLRLPPLTRDLQISYTAPSMAVPEKVRFRYKLDGRDPDWVDSGTRRQAFYSDLGPGDYRFHVIACNKDGVWNEEGATLRFSVAPAWYQTNVFQVLSAVSGALILWALYRLRVHQIEATAGARFDERLAERTRLARDIHDTLLQTIQGSKMVADDALDPATDAARMRGAMENLAEWLARAMQEGRAALHSLRTSTMEGNDLFEAFKRATLSEVVPVSMAATCSVVGDPREMHPIVRDEVYRIGYEAILNACLHSRASRLSVALEYAHDLTLRVTDDGFGIDAAYLDQGKPGHFGLQGMRERAVRIEGKLTLTSSQSSGTAITLVVPGGIAFQKARPTPLSRVREFLTGTSGGRG